MYIYIHIYVYTYIYVNTSVPPKLHGVLNWNFNGRFLKQAPSPYCRKNTYELRNGAFLLGLRAPIQNIDLKEDPCEI